MDITIEQANVPNTYINDPIWKYIGSGYNHSVYRLEEEPEILHIVKLLGYEDTYVIFYEDVYETEPWQTGLQILSSQEILERFSIQL